MSDPIKEHMAAFAAYHQKRGEEMKRAREEDEDLYKKRVPYGALYADTRHPTPGAPAYDGPFQTSVKAIYNEYREKLSGKAYADKWILAGQLFEEGRRESPWIKMAHKLPEDGQEILTGYWDSDRWFCIRDMFDLDYWQKICKRGIVLDKYWMPLPLPPERPKGGTE